MKKIFLFFIPVILIFSWLYFDYFRYKIIINKKMGKHFAIDVENQCYINYEYQCENLECTTKEGDDFPYFNAYFTNLFDAVKYAENNYKKFYNEIPIHLKNKYKDSFNKVYLINSICKKNYDEYIYGYAVTFGGINLYNFYNEYKEYNMGKVKLYTFKEVFTDLKNKNHK